MPKTRLKHDRINELYKIEDHGSYSVFRETENKTMSAGRPVTLVVGFRLKLLRSSSVLHWIFQRVCILTTPFRSGTKGFGIKLWMVYPDSKNYLGIYDWRGMQNAQNYVDSLTRILRPLSVKGSVWYQLHESNLDTYLSERKFNQQGG